MIKIIQKKNEIKDYMVKPQIRHKRVDWRDYIIPTKSKKKRRISEVVDQVVYYSY